MNLFFHLPHTVDRLAHHILIKSVTRRFKNIYTKETLKRKIDTLTFIKTKYHLMCSESKLSSTFPEWHHLQACYRYQCNIFEAFPLIRFFSMFKNKNPDPVKSLALINCMEKARKNIHPPHLFVYYRQIIPDSNNSNAISK